MKKIIQLFMIFMMTIGVVGCQQNEPRNNEYSETYRLLYFYIDGCKSCEAFGKEALPLLEKEFGSQLVIEKYSLDKKDTRAIYDVVLANIEGFPIEEDYGKGPFIVLDGYFAKLGYSSGDQEELLNDFIRAATGKSLGNTLSDRRYAFINTEEEQ